MHVSVGLLLAVLALATYSNAFDAAFTLDSTATIGDSARVHAVTAENLKLILTQSYWWPTVLSRVYRPLTTLSFLVNYAVLGNGQRPAGYHWVNLGLHWANGLLLYLLVLQLGGTRLTACFAGALFVVHPIATEAVTYLVGRSDLLATAAVLGGVLLYIRCQVAPRKLWWRIAFVLAAIAGIFSKENGATLLGVVMLYDVLFRLDAADAASLRRLARCAGDGWVLVLPALALRVVMDAWLARAPGPLPNSFHDNVLVAADFLTGRFTAIKVIGQQLWQLLWPARLCWDYSVDEIPLFGWSLSRWPDQQAILALLVLGAIAVASLARWRRAPAAVFFAGFFVVTLLPTSNLVVLVYATRADRFLYLPSSGAAACAALAASAGAAGVGRWWARRFGARPRWPTWAAVGLVAAAVVSLGVRSHVRNRDWQDQATLCAHDARSCPNSFRLHTCVATQLYFSDRRANIDAAISEAETALAILERTAPTPDAVPGTVLENLGQYYATKAGLVPAAERGPWDVKSVRALERAVAAQDRVSAAFIDSERRRGRRAEDIPTIGTPNLALVYQTLGQGYLQLGEPRKAIDALAYARRLVPGTAAVHSALAAAYAAAGDNENAILSLLETFLCDKSRQDVWPRLYALYQQVDPGGCAFVQAAGQYRFNHDCPIVHRDICAALQRQVDAFRATGDLEVVLRLRDAAVAVHGCDALAAP